MFFIFGINEERKKLDFDQEILCANCGKTGHYEVYAVYMCLSLFFIPVFKWNKRYYMRTTCCDITVEISRELGQSIERGETVSLD